MQKKRRQKSHAWAPLRSLALVHFDSDIPVSDQEDQYAAGLYFCLARCASRLGYICLVYQCVTEVCVLTLVSNLNRARRPMGGVPAASVNLSYSRERVQPSDHQ
jgi:hypothetical protein